MNDFGGKGGLITAAGAGIGRAIALDFARRGGIALVTDRSEELAHQVAAEITSFGGKALAMQLDVASADAISAAVEASVSFAGGLDVLFNVAGINIPKNVEVIDEEEWYLSLIHI